MEVSVLDLSQMGGPVQSPEIEIKWRLDLVVEGTRDRRQPIHSTEGKA